MQNHSLLSRCGIYCGACYVYRAERDDGEFLREIAEWQNVEMNDVKCNGCFASDDEKWQNCKECIPWICLEENELKYCYECDSFWNYSCENYASLEDFCARRGEDIRRNLVKIMADPEHYLEEQDKQWRCDSCREPYSWYEETCRHCGNILNRKDKIK